MAINVTDVVTQFGAYYKPGSDNATTLRNMMYTQQQTAGFFLTRPTEDTIYRGNLASLNRIVQPFQKDFTPIGTSSFMPNQFPLYKLKIDMRETPDDLEATYLGFLANMPEPDRSKWPFVRWLMSNHIMPRRDQDLEMNEYGLGKFVAPTANTPGAAGTAMNGVIKVLYDYAQAGRINFGNGVQALGAIPTEDADLVQYVEDFVDGIDPLLKNKIDKIFLDPQLVVRYKRGKRKKYNQFYAQAADLVSIEDYPSISLQGLESHRGTNIMWATMADNRIAPIKKSGASNMFLVQQFAPRVVSIYADWWTALNFEVPEFIVCNDQFPTAITG